MARSTVSKNGLMLAGQPAHFAPLTALAAIDHAAEADAASEALMGRYEALRGLEDEAFRAHPQRARYLLEYELYVVRIPALRAAWANGDRPEADAIARSPLADVLACCREVRRLNPFLTDLPPPEDDRPNG